MEQFLGKAQLSTHDYINASRLVTLNIPLYRIILFVISPICIILGIYFSFSDFLRDGLPLFIFPVLMYFIIFVRMPNRIKKTYLNSEKMKQEAKYAISEIGLQIETNDISEKWDWKEFYKFVESELYILVFLKSNRNYAKIIVKDAFSPNDLGMIRNILKTKVKKENLITAST
jgi:hypothetical protein